MLIIQGLVGPKPMAKAAGDGQTVNIPLPSYFFNGVTEASMLKRIIGFALLASGISAGKSAGSLQWQFQAPIECSAFERDKFGKAAFQEKISRAKDKKSVPQTDTGR